MSEPEPEDPALEPIRATCSGAVTRREDGWRKIIHMERLRFFVNGAEKEMDALLVLNHNNASYPTKLYLAENVGGGVNWNENAYILARNWYTFSWSGVSPSLRPVEILAAHLAALNRACAA